MSPERLFVLGAPRSGTTFLSSILESSRFGTPVESHFITKYARRLSDYGSLQDTQNFERLCNDILSERPIMQWKLDLSANDLYQKLIDKYGEIKFANLVDLLFLSRSEAEGLNAWSDKTPNYLEHLPLLDDLFSNAKYIYIVRDGRDVAQSVINKPWGPNNVLVAAEYWQRLNLELPVFKKLTSEGRILSIRYEDLISDMQAAIKQIEIFIDEEYSSDEVSRLCSSAKPENSLKWKTSMKASDVKLFDSAAAETLQRFGYEVIYEDSTNPSWKRYFYLTHNYLSWLRFMFMSNVVDGFKIRFMSKEPFAE